MTTIDPDLDTNQDPAPESLKHPEIVINPPAETPEENSQKILRTPRRRTPSPGNEELNEESFMEGMSEKLKEIQHKADLIDSPGKRNIFIENEYWGWIAKAAVNLNWNLDKLDESIKEKKVFKSYYISNAKRLRQLPLGAEIGTGSVSIGNPDLVSSKEQLEFIIHLHDVIEKLELRAPNKKLTTRSKLPTGRGTK